VPGGDGRPHCTRPAAIARFRAATGFAPGCRELRMRPSLPARAGHDRPVPLAACSHVRSSPEHEAPISARNVCENPRDKSSCRARFHDLFRRSSVLRLFAQRKCPIHVRQLAVSTTVPQRFCKNRPPSVLFRLAPINLKLGLHDSAPRTAGPGFNVQMQLLFRVLAAQTARRRVQPSAAFAPELALHGPGEVKQRGCAISRRARISYK
jgi:hypothetical protein